MDAELVEFGGEDDHVHLLVTVPPKLAISNLVGKLKGKSSYFYGKSIMHSLRKSYRGNIYGLLVIVLLVVVVLLLRLLKHMLKIRENPQVKKLYNSLNY